ncbi:hypothetical protein SEA_GUDMIT_31 [Gordonia phage Gudmit]|nr:hypothetical protein SEA_GUDMIT_31 [Gordonia phage Gudmit]
MDESERPHPDDAVQKIHCSFCGAQVMFDRLQVYSLLVVPPCPRCKEQTWLHIDGQPVVWPAAR